MKSRKETLEAIIARKGDCYISHCNTCNFNLSVHYICALIKGYSDSHFDSCKDYILEKANEKLIEILLEEVLNQNS